MIKIRCDSQRLSIIREHIYEESRTFLSGYLLSYIHSQSLRAGHVGHALASLVSLIGNPNTSYRLLSELIGSWYLTAWRLIYLMCECSWHLLLSLWVCSQTLCPSCLSHKRCALTVRFLFTLHSSLSLPLIISSLRFSGVSVLVRQSTMLTQKRLMVV